jgi:hypothetical protein
MAASINIPSKRQTVMDLIQESVHTSDDIDIGDIEAINKNMIVVKRGIRNVHYYYIPIDKVEGWDENIVWLTITEIEVKKGYERDEEPIPPEYFINGQAYDDIDVDYTEAYFPKVTIIPSKTR